VVDVTVALATEMCALADLDADPRDVLTSGGALPVWRKMVRAQGGDPDADPPAAREVDTVTASRSGILTRLGARAVGVAAWRLGAGRARKEDAVSATAGVVCRVKPGDTVKAGEPLLDLHTDDPARFPAARDALAGAIEIGDASIDPRPLILDRVAI
jgi:thymidine phosphorylase